MHVKKYFNSLDFINWDLFIKLFNLKTNVSYYNYPHSSLYYLFRLKKTNNKLLKFLIKLPKETINWKIYCEDSNSNFLSIIFFSEELYEDTELINLILNSDIFDKSMWEEKNKYNLNAIKYFLLYCNYSNLIIKALELNLINIGNITEYKYSVNLINSASG